MTNRQSRSSLGFVADATTIRLSDGSINVNANTLTATNLQPSTTMKTDASRNIVSADLFLSDIKDYVPPVGTPLYNPLTANLSMGNFNINNTNNLNTQTINSKVPLYNPATTALDMAGNDINDMSILTFSNASTIDSSTADLSINVPGAGRILSGSIFETTGDLRGSNVTATGVINGDIVGIGLAQPNQTGYNFPIARPLIAGQVMVTPPAASNTLLFRTANLDGILNQTSILGISTTIANALILGSPTYQMPTARGTNNQYIKTDGAGLCSFATFPTPTYAQIGRQLQETVGYSLVANVFKSATTLGGTMDTTFPNSANITPNSAVGTLTYTELATKTLVVELDLRARIGDNKNADGLLTLNLISGVSTILAFDIARVYNNESRTHLSCKIVQPVATGTVFSFSIGYDKNLTNNIFLSSISLSIYGAGF